MVDRPVNFVIGVEGGDEAQRDFEDLAIKEQEAVETTTRLNAALRDLQKAGGDNGKAIDAMRRQVIRATQAQEKLKAEIGGSSIEAIAFQAKAQALGSTIGQVGAVLGRVNPEWARMGAAIGGIGAQIPALTGSLGPVAQGIAAITVAVDLGTMAWEAWTGETEAAGRAANATKRQITDLANSLTQLHERQQAIAGAGAIAPLEERFAAADQRVVSLQETLDSERERAETGRSEAATRIAELRREQLTAIEANPANAGLIRVAGTQAREIEQLTEGVQRANDRVRNLAEETRRQRAVTDEAEDALARARNRPAGFSELDAPDSGGGGGGGDDGVEAAQQRAEAALASGLARQQRLREAAQADITRLGEKQLAEQLTALEAQREIERVIEEERFAAIRKRIDEEREAAELQLELLERAESEAREATARVKADAEGVLGPMLSGLTDALGNIIAGAETADEAFQGLLAGFLEMIAQRAALEAASEFAAAIGDFASQNYSSGALHLAAGAAWTVVAVAAGAGSVAAAPAQTAPVSPETGADAGEGGGGGTNVFNINGTIISAEGPGARARAGREIGGLFNEGARRFGRSG